MIIKNITIENFQSYHESQTMDFSNGLNLIIGNGGKGKSKLFNAFYWVLFGRIYVTGVGWCTTDSLPQSAKFSMQRYEFINKRALYNASVNDEVISSVQIELEDDKGINYIKENYNQNTLIADIKKSNARSISFFEAMGFKKEYELENK